MELQVLLLSGKIHNTRYWEPPYVGWVKWNKDALKIEAKRTSTIIYACRDSTGSILFIDGKKIRDHHILVIESCNSGSYCEDHSETIV